MSSLRAPHTYFHPRCASQKSIVLRPSVDDNRRMNAIHDMGGRHGFGKIDARQNDPVFKHRWHGRVYAMAMHKPLPVADGFRYMIEKLPADTYLSYSYSEE